MTRSTAMRDALLRAGLDRPRLPAGPPSEAVATVVRPSPTVAPRLQSGPAAAARTAATAMRPAGPPREPSGPAAALVTRPAWVVEPPACRLVQTGPFVPHELFSASTDAAARRVVPRHGGIARQLTARPSNAADLILGLDFGTSCTKAVIRDDTSGRSYVVPFTDSATQPWLLPSRVWRSGERYSLDVGERAIRDLKLRLIDCDAPSPAAEFDDACAYLALVIRHCRGWLLDTHAATFRSHELLWRVNLGLPARSYEDKRLVRLFRRLAWAAANCAVDDCAEITVAHVQMWRELSHDAIARGEEAVPESAEFLPEDIDVVPEIAAQIHGFVEAGNWDVRNRPMMLMVDIGAGTVDSALFSVVQNAQKAWRFSFFSSGVESHGVMNLHRERVGWLQGLTRQAACDPEVHAWLQRVAQPTDRSKPLPAHDVDYLPGFRVERPVGGDTVDDLFYRRRYHRHVASCIQQARRDKGVPDSQLQQLPVFLCGGGARMEFYARIIRSTNEAPWAVRVQRQMLPKPASMQADCVGPDEFDRLSVAYGLSQQGAGGKPLGEYVRSMEIPPMAPRPIRDWSERYIDK